MLAGLASVEPDTGGAAAAKPHVGPTVTPDLLAAVSGPPLTGRALWLTLILDAAMYSALLCRNYKDHISWYAISDLVALWVPAERRLWWQPFRVHAAITLMALEGTLAFLELEPMDPWLLLRLCLCLCRAAQAGAAVTIGGARCGGGGGGGPSRRQLAALPAYGRFYLDMRGGGGISSVPLVKLLFALAAALLPHIFYMTHYNFGEDRIDAPLTAFQSSFSIQMYTKVMTRPFKTRAKVFILELMIAEPLYAGCSELATSLLFLAQWPPMFEMFWRAPLPLVHVAAEAAMLASALAAIGIGLHRSRSGGSAAAPRGGG